MDQQPPAINTDEPQPRTPAGNWHWIAVSGIARTVLGVAGGAVLGMTVAAILWPTSWVAYWIENGELNGRLFAWGNPDREIWTRSVELGLAMSCAVVVVVYENKKELDDLFKNTTEPSAEKDTAASGTEAAIAPAPDVRNDH